MQPPYGQPQFPPAQHPQPQYTPQYPPPQYPVQQYAQPRYPPAQYPAPAGAGQPIVIPVEGTGAAKLAARLNRRALVFSATGFAHQAKRGAFQIAWAEFRRIAITTAFHKATGQPFAQKVWRVRVIMDAADPGFPQRHPELSGLQGRYGGTGAGSYGLPLGPVPNIVGQLAQGFAIYAAPIFGGVIEEGQVISFSYL